VYMPVRFGTGRVISQAWNLLSSGAAGGLTVIAGDLNAEGTVLRRGKEVTEADVRLDGLLEGGWHRVGNAECTYRDSVIDHWLVSDSGGGWTGGEVSGGLSGEGEHSVLEVTAASAEQRGEWGGQAYQAATGQDA
jgi:hypothetical protein